MEAATQNQAQTTRPPEFYSAELRVDDASVRISTSNLSLLTRLIERVKQPTLAPAGAPFPPIAAVSAEEKQAVAQPVATPAAAKPEAKAETPKAQPKKEPAAAAGKPAQQEATAASSPTAAAAPADAPATTYDDVKAVVNKVYAISPDAATDLIKSFGVDHAKRLTEAQWPELVAKGKDLLASLGK